MGSNICNRLLDVALNETTKFLLVACHSCGLVWSGSVIRSPPLECVADGLGCLITAGPSGDGLPNEC